MHGRSVGVGRSAGVGRPESAGRSRPVGALGKPRKKRDPGKAPGEALVKFIPYFLPFLKGILPNKGDSPRKRDSSRKRDSPPKRGFSRTKGILPKEGDSSEQICSTDFPGHQKARGPPGRFEPRVRRDDGWSAHGPQEFVLISSHF